ncbi:ATP-binding cassette domain-containing protein [Gelidibacter japonicus]|jgi:ABC-type multidrug transport system ATPase subunit|uniref:ATP-binding cassette domain-containing protein n=1 Tax=Gelidibacter japonicus TaxID=1962232 RepID=UPI002AFFD58D|nr:ATP-binding cassette domain-containing protein [Gelidibacter japonicus]
MIIELDNVELNFNKRRILYGIYLKAETGQVVGLLGRNGSGKSCLLQVLFGSLQPKYKFIKLDGQPLIKPLYTLNIASYLPQHHLAPDHIRVQTLFQILKLDWGEFIGHFENFQVHHNSKINRLSGGERRVVETYAVLKQKGDIVLLDEPFSNISPLYLDNIKNLITTEKAHKIIIITDHYYRDVIDISDALYLLNNGCTRKTDKLEDLEDYNYLNPGKLKSGTR